MCTYIYIYVNVYVSVALSNTTALDCLSTLNSPHHQQRSPPSPVKRRRRASLSTQHRCYLSLGQCTFFGNASHRHFSQHSHTHTCIHSYLFCTILYYCFCLLLFLIFLFLIFSKFTPWSSGGCRNRAQCCQHNCALCISTRLVSLHTSSQRVATCREYTYMSAAVPISRCCRWGWPRRAAALETRVLVCSPLIVDVAFASFVVVRLLLHRQCGAMFLPQILCFILFLLDDCR